MTLMAGFKASHFLWRVEDAVAVIQLNRPERKNPLTFDSYAELRDAFRKLPYANDIHVVVFLPNGGNFCSGGDVHEIIGPLVAMDMKDLLAFTRMTGDLVKAMLQCGKPIITAIDGIAAGTEIAAVRQKGDGFDIVGINKIAEGVAQFGVGFERERIFAVGPVQFVERCVQRGGFS